MRKAYSPSAFIRAVESLRVKGNESLKRLHEFIGENKKLRRCMNRLFFGAKPGGFHLRRMARDSKEEFYAWLKGSIATGEDRR